MAKATSPSKEQRIEELLGQVAKLQAQLVKTKDQSIDEYIQVKVQKSQSRFERIRNLKGADQGVGKYFLLIDIAAKKEDVYVPVSVASGKKATSFIYQIEGTAIGSISRASVTARGEGTMQITLGTILYCKIPAGKKAAFRIQIEIKGKIGKSYKIVINRINYKLNPSDTRYKRFQKEISTKLIRFN